MKVQGTKRDRVERSKGQLRSVFAEVPAKIAERADAREILAGAFIQAGKITDFALKYFPHYMLDEKTGEAIPPAKFHQEIYEILLTQQFAVVAAPREHAKSTVVSLIFPVYCVCEKLRRFILLISDTQPQARLLLGAIKAEFEENESVRADYGDLVPRGDGAKWAEEDIVTVTGIRVSARGAGQSLRGLRQRAARPDLVILDDIEEDEKVENPESRAKLMNWFKRAVLQLGKHCQFLVIGTILHHDSFLANLLKPDRFLRFIKRTYQAVDDLWSPESVLWPERWPLETLKQKCEDIGPAEFDQELRNKPVSIETQTFDPAWFEQHYYTWEEIRGRVLRKIVVIDPAIRQKQSADLFAVGGIGVDDAGTIFVLRAEGTRIPFHKQVERVIEVFLADRPMQVGIETIAYQEALKTEVERVSKGKNIYVPVVELRPHTDKIMRIASLAPLIENGTIRFRRDQVDAIRQFTQFPKADHDDIPDALEQAVDMIRKVVPAACLGSGDEAQTPQRHKSIWESGVGSREPEEEAEEVGAGRMAPPRPGLFGPRMFLR